MRKTKLKTRTKALSIKEAPVGEVPAPREGEFYDMEETAERHTELARTAARDLMLCGEFDHFVVEVIHPARANVHHTPTGKVYKYTKDSLGWDLKGEGRFERKPSYARNRWR